MQKFIKLVSVLAKSINEEYIFQAKSCVMLQRPLNGCIICELFLEDC